MKETTYTYDKRFIMTNAWRHYRVCPGITFADSLRWSWARAREDKKAAEYNAFRRLEHERKYGAQDRRLSALYGGVVFGKTDYAVSYGKRYRVVC